jgi:metal-responsive CopG/Arc/MetJ family transcriptional regulator
MKSHISATIDTDLLRRLDRLAAEERRSRSQAIELAIERFLAEENELSSLPVSEGNFQGRFSRDETYAGR